MADILLGNVRGPIGPEGQPGATGETGQAATIEIGSVSTTAYGNPAQVVNSGTEEAAILDFTIPQGKPGEQTTRMGALTLDTITAQTATFPVPAVGETGATVFGKIIKFFTDTVSALASKLNVSDVINNLTSTATDKPLSANMGRQLNSKYMDNAGGHNCIYRGKYLGTSVTNAQWAVISAGTFEDLYIGDYWTIGGVNYRIADFDYFYRSGDTECTTHHIVIVPDTNLDNQKMNDTNITTGGYTGSKMYTNYMATAKNKIISAFGSGHILSHREYLTNAVANGRPSGGAWFDSTIELMSEAMCYGGTFFEPVSDGSTVPIKYSVACKQLNLFRHRPDMISNHQTFWLRNVVSATNFASVYINGTANYGNASVSYGVRPAFSIK